MRFMKFNVRRRNKNIVTAVTVAVLLGGLGLGVKTFFFADPAAAEARKVVKSIQTALESAQSKADQGDSTGARNLLFGSISSLRPLVLQEVKDAQSTEQKAASLLDALDNAQEIAPVLVSDLTADIGTGEIITAHNGSLFVYSFDAQANAGLVLKVENGTVQSQRQVKDMHADILFPNDGTPVLIDRSAQKIGLSKENEVSVAAIDMKTPVSMDLYQENLYILSADSIYKIADAAQGYAKSSVWLAKDQAVPAQGSQIVIDGNASILSESGTITTYYKGEKESEIDTPFTPTKNTKLLTHTDSPLFYLIDSTVNRIYLIDKKLGTVTKTYKFPSSQQFVSVALDADGSLYVLTPDNKIWKVQ